MDPAAGNFALKNGSDITDKGEPLREVREDFCGNRRDGQPDLGAIEFGDTKSCLPFGLPVND